MNDPLDWQTLGLFLAVVRGGGLAAGARATGLSAPTLGRRMTALEGAMGERLFERGARGYALTAAGEALLERVVAMDDAAGEIEAWRRGDRQRRRVRISAGGWTGLRPCHVAWRRGRRVSSTRRTRFGWSDGGPHSGQGRRDAEGRSLQSGSAPLRSGSQCLWS